MEPDTAGIFARRMAFITANGLPWEQDPLYDREKRMLEAQARDEALEAQIRKDQAAVPASGRLVSPEDAVIEGETLDLVRPEDL